MEPESNYCIKKNPHVSILSYIYPLHAFPFICFKPFYVYNITFLSMWDSHVFHMALPTPLAEWLSNTSKCTSLECGHHKKATKVVLLVCSNYHITCTTQVCTDGLLLFKPLSVHNFLFINHSNFYHLFNPKKIYKWAWKYMSSVLPACLHPTELYQCYQINHG